MRDNQSESAMFEFLEWPGFASRRDDLLDDEEYRALQNTLLDAPRFAPVIPGTGGCRKMRVRRAGAGKSRGFRVVYYVQDAKGRIHLLYLFAKNERSDLSQSQRNTLKTLIQGLAVSVTET